MLMALAYCVQVPSFRRYLMEPTPLHRSVAVRVAVTLVIYQPFSPLVPCSAIDDVGATVSTTVEASGDVGTASRLPALSTATE
jgi:hypothetical protein